jgi:mRNA interferase MazF
LKRGDVVVTVIQGDHGKPRPAVVVQADEMNAAHPTLIVCLISSEITEHEFRLTLAPDLGTGLRVRSQVMIDKLHAVRREKIGQRIGALSSDQIALLDRKLVAVLGLASHG